MLHSKFLEQTKFVKIASLICRILHGNSLKLIFVLTQILNFLVSVIKSRSESRKTKEYLTQNNRRMPDLT